MPTPSPATISAASLIYVHTRVSAKESGVAVDPTADTVAMAFISGSTTPAPGDWKTASWDTDPTTAPPTYRARCLVGPGGAVTLLPGTWNVWVRVTDSPEIPVLPCGPLRVV